jgi:hypothetical protein
MAGGIAGIGLWVEGFFHAVALAFKAEGLGVVEDAVEDGGGEGAVVVVAGSLLHCGTVIVEQSRAAFGRTGREAALRDHLPAGLACKRPTRTALNNRPFERHNTV